MQASEDGDDAGAPGEGTAQAKARRRAVPGPWKHTALPGLRWHRTVGVPVSSLPPAV